MKILIKAINRQIYKKVAHGVFVPAGKSFNCGKIRIGKRGAQCESGFKSIMKAFARKRRRACEYKPFSVSCRQYAAGQSDTLYCYGIRKIFFKPVFGGNFGA